MAYAHAIITDILLMFLYGMIGLTAGVLSIFLETWVVAVMGDTNVIAEIEKCEIVCSNCHRIRTYERKQRLRRHDHE